MTDERQGIGNGRYIMRWPLFGGANISESKVRSYQNSRYCDDRIWKLFVRPLKTVGNGLKGAFNIKGTHIDMICMRKKKGSYGKKRIEMQELRFGVSVSHNRTGEVLFGHNMKAQEIRRR